MCYVKLFFMISYNKKGMMLYIFFEEFANLIVLI